MPLIKNVNEFNERITFLGSDYEAPSADNGWQLVEIDGIEVYSCWCMVKTQFLSDLTSQAGTVLENTVNFVIRSQQGYDINNELQVKWNDVVYDIVDINPDTAKKQYDVIIGKKVGE